MSSELNKLTFFQAEVLIAVAECRNLSKAAERLYMTPSAVSKLVSKVESALDTRLFIRNGRGVELTAAANLLLPRWKDSMKDMSDALSEVLELKAPLNLQIGITGMQIGTQKLWPLVERFRRKYPDAIVSIYGSTCDNIVLANGLQQGIYDCLFFPEFAKNIPMHDVVSLPVWQDEVTLFYNKDHPLANRKITDFSQLSRERFVTVIPGPTSCYNGYLHRLAEANGFVPDIAGVVSDISLMDYQLVTNQGIFVWGKSCTVGVNNPDIESQSIEGLYLNAICIWNSNSRNPCVRMFTDLLNRPDDTD